MHRVGRAPILPHGDIHRSDEVGGSEGRTHFVPLSYFKEIIMALQKHRHQQGFWHKAAKTVETGIKVAGTAKALYDAGRIAYSVARTAAPVVSALL